MIFLTKKLIERCYGGVILLFLVDCGDKNDGFTNVDNDDFIFVASNIKSSRDYWNGLVSFLKLDTLGEHLPVVSNHR